MDALDRTIAEAVEMGRRLGYVLLATVNASGFPNMAAAGTLRLLSGHRVSVSGWFCPDTAENLETNPRVAVIAWDSVTDEGRQVLGLAEEVRDVAVLDGYLPDESSDERHPSQVEREVLIGVESVLDLRMAPSCGVSQGPVGPGP